MVVSPIGFISDHMEVLYDLDTEARQLAEATGLNMVRAATVGAHPSFVRMIRELIVERTNPDVPRRSLGTLGPRPDACPQDCALPPTSRPARDPRLSIDAMKNREHSFVGVGLVPARFRTKDTGGTSPAPTNVLTATHESERRHATL